MGGIPPPTGLWRLLKAEIQTSIFRFRIVVLGFGLVSDKCYQWPPFSILPHFDVNNISVAQKLTKLWIFKENLSNCNGKSLKT